MAIRYQTILAGTDFSTLADAALEAALGIARRMDARRLHIVHVASAASQIEAAKERLNQLAVSADGLQISREVRAGPPAKVLAEIGQEVGADLIVVASRGLSGLKRMIGSVADALIRAARAPVLVVGGNRRTSGDFSSVIAGLDGSPMGQLVFSHAIEMARMSSGLVRAVSVFEPGPQRRSPAELAKQEIERRDALRALSDSVEHGGVRVSLEVTMRDSAAVAILERAAKEAAPLIVVGTSGHNAIQRAILGSTASQVVSDAKCPVLAVPRASESHSPGRPT